MPAVGNLTDDNGDGLINAGDSPDVVFAALYENLLVAMRGDGSGRIFQVSGFAGWNGEGVAIADIVGDGTPEVVAFTEDSRLAAVDASGRIVWQSEQFSFGPLSQVTVCDLDSDGTAEVIGDNVVLNGEDGSTVAILRGFSGAPVCADLDQDGSSEILVGNGVFAPSGELLWSSEGFSQRPFAAVLDTDGDDGGEVFFVGGYSLYLYDEDGTLLHDFGSIPGGGPAPGPPCVADFDGDGAADLAVPNGTLISMFRADGTLVWSAEMLDASSGSGCSGYDVNGDGAYEVLFADEIAFRIHDGATGAVLFEDLDHTSGTWLEYPVTVDIDNDGSAEILVASNGSSVRGVAVYGHSGDGWSSSGNTWPTHDFSGFNVGPDGSVPSRPEAAWLVDQVFRARPTTEDFHLPDLVVNILDACIADCTYGPAAMSVQVSNLGRADVEPGTELSLFASDDGGLRLVGSQTLPAIPSGSKIEGIELEINAADLGSAGFLVVVDDAGTVAEGRESNNDAWLDGECP